MEFLLNTVKARNGQFYELILHWDAPLSDPSTLSPDVIGKVKTLASALFKVHEALSPGKTIQTIDAQGSKDSSGALLHNHAFALNEPTPEVEAVFQEEGRAPQERTVQMLWERFSYYVSVPQVAALEAPQPQVQGPAPAIMPRPVAGPALPPPPPLPAALAPPSPAPIALPQAPQPQVQGPAAAAQAPVDQELQKWFKRLPLRRQKRLTEKLKLQWPMREHLSDLDVQKTYAYFKQIRKTPQEVLPELKAKCDQKLSQIKADERTRLERILKEWTLKGALHNQNRAAPLKELIQAEHNNLRQNPTFMRSFGTSASLSSDDDYRLWILALETYLDTN